MYRVYCTIGTSVPGLDSRVYETGDTPPGPPVYRRCDGLTMVLSVPFFFELFIDPLLNSSLRDTETERLY